MPRVEITRAYKFRLAPTPEQRTALWGAAERSRRAWNWAVRQLERENELALRAAGVLEGELPLRRKQRIVVVAKTRARAKEQKIKLDKPPISFGRLYKLWCQQRDENPNSYYHSHTASYPIERVVKAWKEFFGRKKRAHPPKPHGDRHPSSFTVQLQRRSWDDTGIKIPGIGHVLTVWHDKGRCGESPSKIPPSKPCSVTVTRQANKWYASIAMKGVSCEAEPGIGVIGLDLGVKATITTSEGEQYPPPRPLLEALRRLAILQRRFQRKPVRSRRRTLLNIQIAKLHARVADIRNNYLHNLTTALARRYSTVVVEGFDIQDLVHRGVEWRKIRQAMHDIAWGELRRQLEYKLAWRGSESIVCPPLHPTNRQCAACWIRDDAIVLNECPPSQAIYRCSVCGTKTPRQINTAKLLEIFGRTGLPSTGAQPEGPQGPNARGGAESTTRGAAPSKREHCCPRPAPGASPGAGAFLSSGGSARTQDRGLAPSTGVCKKSKSKTAIQPKNFEILEAVATESSEQQ